MMRKVSLSAFVVSVFVVFAENVDGCPSKFKVLCYPICCVISLTSINYMNLAIASTDCFCLSQQININLYFLICIHCFHNSLYINFETNESLGAGLSILFKENETAYHQKYNII